MSRAVFPLVPDPTDARPLQPPTADEIARIRAALPTGTPIMKGKWESMDTAPRDGRPVWARVRLSPEFATWPGWVFYDESWRAISGFAVSNPTEWFNPEAAP